jgi:rubrerythrin
LDTGSLLLILSITILVGLFISRPFYSDYLSTQMESTLDTDLLKSELEVESLMAEKDRLFSALQELDSDHSLGKIPDEEYHTQRTKYKNAAALVLRKIDEMDTQIPTAVAVDNKQPHTSSTEFVTGGKMDEIEEMVAARRRSRNEKSAGFCPHCGKVIQKSDQFCPVCGSKVAE